MKLILIAACLALAQRQPKGKSVNPRKPPKDKVSTGITYSGTGCPPGSASIALSEDKSSFTIIFSKFIASTPSETRKDCFIDVDLKYPEEWSFAIQSIDYRGYVQLPAGMSAIHRSKFSFQGNKNPASKTSLVGPKYEDYFIREEQELEFSECRRRVKGKIRTVIQLFGNSPEPARMTVDSVDKTVVQTYSIQWKQC